MAATVEIRSYHGATPDAGTNVAGSNIRLKQADNDTVDTANPVPIPASGTNYSYVKNLAFYAVSSPANSLSNLKFYSDGSNGLGSGVGLQVKANDLFQGTATSGTTTTLTDSGASFTGSNGLAGYVLEITSGTNSGSARRITSNTGTQVTVASAFSSAIDNTSVYRIWYIDPINLGAAQLAGTSSAFGYVSGAPLTLTGTLTNPATGRFGQGVAIQLTVASTASAGTTAVEQVTFSYDES